MLASKEVDIAALSETRLLGEGQLTEEGGGYTPSSGKERMLASMKRLAGVGFAVRTKLLTQIKSIPKGINKRLMVLKLRLAYNQFVTLISAYAPTMTCNDTEKEIFYFQLEDVLQQVPKKDKLYMLGDFNARVGRDTAAWDGVLGDHGVGAENANAHCYSASAPHMSWPPQTHCFDSRTNGRLRGCTHDRNTPHPRSSRDNILVRP